MPEPFRNFVTTRASRVFEQRYLGDEALQQELLQAEQQAYQGIMEHEHDLEHNNFSTNQAIVTLMNR